MDRLSDDELAVLAMAADPDQAVDPDAVPFGVDEDDGGLLPAWYMPTPRGLDRRPTTRFAVAGIILALLAVNGAGLCVTYGFPEIAW